MKMQNLTCITFLPFGPHKSSQCRLFVQPTELLTVAVAILALTRADPPFLARLDILSRLHLQHPHGGLSAGDLVGRVVAQSDQSTAECLFWRKCGVGVFGDNSILSSMSL